MSEEHRQGVPARKSGCRARAALFSLGLGLAAIGLTGCATGRGWAGPGNIYSTIAAYPEILTETFDSPDATAPWRTADPTRWKPLDGRIACQSDNDSHSDFLLTNAVYADGLVEAQVSLENGSVGSAGLVVRATPDYIGWKSGSALIFALGFDGEHSHFAVFRQFEGQISYLAPWTPVEGVPARKNRVGAFLRGDTVQLYLNGEMVWEGQSADPADGHIGFFASTSPDLVCTHTFDNLIVRVGDSGPDAAPAPAASTSEAIEKAPKSGRAKGKGKAEAKEGPPSTALAGAVLGADRSPLLRPGFVVRVSVLASGKREIDSEVKRVSDNYQLDLPLIGAVAVEGMTLTSLITDLQNRYKDYFINPQVVAEFVVEERADAVSPWGSVVVLGRVKSPGKVNIPPTQDLTVSGAIQQAGGLDTSARASSIRLTRRTADGKSERINIDLTAVGQQGVPENDLILRPGDLIFVPERIF